MQERQRQEEELEYRIAQTRIDAMEAGAEKELAQRELDNRREISLLRRQKAALDTLAALDKDDCTRAQARQAWDDVFDTTFFSDQPDPDASKKAAAGGAVMEVTKVETARRDDGGGRFG